MKQLSFTFEDEVNNMKDAIAYVKIHIEFVTDLSQPKSSVLQTLSSLYYAIVSCSRTQESLKKEEKRKIKRKKRRKKRRKREGKEEKKEQKKKRKRR